MGDFMVHRIRFYDYQPRAIQSIAYDDLTKKLAVSRADNSIEIWCLKNEFQESTITPTLDRQVEVVLWCRSQLFSAGLDAFIVQYDLAKLNSKRSTPSVGGAIWCMTKNKAETKIAIGSEDGFIALFEMSADGLIYEKTFNKQDSRILSIAWHKDEELIVTGGIDNIRIWDVKSGQVSQRISIGRLERNKETIVWCLAITANFTIISGDSRGKTSFWNSEHGTLIKSFQTHSVDVLCLCVDENEERVYCSGIDPTIVELDYVTVNEDDEYKSWVKSNLYYNHSHDVRAMTVANNQLISAGVDTKLIFKSIKSAGKSKTRKYQFLPKKELYDVVDDFILMQYDKHIELWKLGQTEINQENIKLNENGDCLPISRAPKKYLNLKSKGNHNIKCSTIGSMKNHLWLSYSDLNNIHLYRLNIKNLDSKFDINVEKIKQLPLASLKPAICMKFINETNRLCYITNQSCLLCLKLIDNDEFLLECCIQCIQDVTLTENRIYAMCCKNDYVATADTDLNINIWNLNTQTHLCSLPRYDYMCTSMCFSYKNNFLFVVYSNRNMIEYDCELNEYTTWSRKISNKLPKEWLKSNLKIINCFYDNLNEDKIILNDEQYLISIDKNQKMPELNQKIFKNNKCLALSLTNKYRYIVYLSQMKNGQMVLVELTPLIINERLPPSLKQKKFGT